jgi:hypothetical protein
MGTKQMNEEIASDLSLSTIKRIHLFQAFPFFRTTGKDEMEEKYNFYFLLLEDKATDV